MFLTLLLLSLSSVAAEEYLSCDAQVILGNSSCKNPQPGLKYFYDSKALQCYRFTYFGCNKGTNHYDTEDECLRCRPADIQTCGGNAEPTGSCILESMEGGKRKCPEGSECQMGFMVGICCDKAKTVEWEEEQKPKCPHGKLVTKNAWFGEITYFGRKCAHKFCPDNTDCFEGKYLAYCCDNNAKNGTVPNEKH